MVIVRPWDKSSCLQQSCRNKNRVHRSAKSDNNLTAWQQFRCTQNFYFSKIKHLKFEEQK